MSKNKTTFSADLFNFYESEIWGFHIKVAADLHTTIHKKRAENREQRIEINFA